MDAKDRIKKARQYLNINTQQSLADKLEVDRSKIADIESGRTKNVPVEIATKFEEISHINGWWLLTGKGKMTYDDTKLKDSYYFDVLNVKASAGSGITTYDVEIIDKFLIDKKVFKTPQNEETTKFLKVEGDSMEPTIKDGDYIAIDENCIDNIDGIYACIIGDGVRVKRLQFNLDGTIKIISDNQKYDPQIYDPKNSQIYFKIIGRKILSIQR